MHASLACDVDGVDLADIEAAQHMIRQAGSARGAAARFVRLSAQPFAGAPFPSPVTHPLNPPTITSTELNIDLMLQQPTRITRLIMDLTLQRFFVDRVFASGGGVTGGAVIFDVVAANDLYADRDVQRVEPGSEFPEINFSRRAPGVATVEKWGGKYRIFDESKDRNIASVFMNANRQLSNTIVRKINQRGVAVLDAAVTANSRTLVAHNWTTIVTGGSSMTNASAWPAADFAAVALQADQEELNVVYDLWIMNPADYFQLVTVYGDRLSALLDSAGISIFVTNRVPAHSAYVVASNQVGEMRVEQPLGTETWRDANGKQLTWVQSSVRPLMFVDNPFAVLKVTGLAG